MSIGSLKDLYFDELGDLYDAETQVLRALPRLCDAARAPELRDALRKHAEESRLHLERLQLIFTHWGERLASKPCPAVAGIVQEADDRVNEATTPDVRDAAIIGAAQRIEHYEIAAYGCARTYARRLNRTDEARLLQETLDEEGRADRRLTEIAEAHVNDDARTELDLHERPKRSAMRYVPARELRNGGPAAAFEIRNDADDDLGRLDGFVLGASERPQYIVVDPRGVFTRRRYLLPVSHVRLDERAHVLRVDLDKDVADRYPEFERDAFERMDESGWRGYEKRLLSFFPPAMNHAGTRSATDGTPEWLLTGMWMTLPAERAERLPNEAKAYINELTPDSSEEEKR
jgi:ferritin-like metal-binding protein YciE